MTYEETPLFFARPFILKVWMFDIWQNLIFPSFWFCQIFYNIVLLVICDKIQKRYKNLMIYEVFCHHMCFRIVNILYHGKNETRGTNFDIREMDSETRSQYFRIPPNLLRSCRLMICLSYYRKWIDRGQFCHIL